MISMSTTADGQERKTYKTVCWTGTSGKGNYRINGNSCCRELLNNHGIVLLKRKKETNCGPRMIEYGWLSFVRNDVMC